VRFIKHKIYSINVDFHTKYNLLEKYELPIMPSLYKSIVSISIVSISIVSISIVSISIVSVLWVSVLWVTVLWVSVLYQYCEYQYYISIVSISIVSISIVSISIVSISIVSISIVSISIVSISIVTVCHPTYTVWKTNNYCESPVVSNGTVVSESGKVWPLIVVCGHVGCRKIMLGVILE
jgi:hypothetical protein